MVPRGVRDHARTQGGPPDAAARGRGRGGPARGLAGPGVRAFDRARGVPHGRARDRAGARRGEPSLHAGGRPACRVRASVPRRAGGRDRRRPRADRRGGAPAAAAARSVARDADPLHDGRGRRGRSGPPGAARAGVVPRPGGGLRRADPDRRAVPRAARTVPRGHGRPRAGGDVRRDRRAVGGGEAA